MRVLMTADAVGGVWTYALELADALEPHGVELALATMGPAPSEAQRREAEAAAVASLHVSTYALEWMEEPWREVKDAAAWLLDLADEVAPDLVHLNGFAHASLPWPAPVLVVGHSCVLSWWAAVKDEPPPARLGDYDHAVRSGLHAADVLVAPTRALLAELERLYEPACERRVIPNGRSPMPARPKEPFVLSAGRAWDAAKNVAAVDAAAAGLSWPVLVAGAEPGSLRHAEALGVVDRATLDDLLGRAAVFAAPARYEPFGLGALEAALAGCALVLGDIPSLREVWDDAAWYVDPRDERALHAALTALIEDDARRVELGQRARRRAARYTPERMASAYVETYSRLAARARTRRIEVAS